MKTQQEWDEHFVAMADEVAKGSPDKSTKIACVIVDKNHEVVASAHTSHPAGADESKLTWDERPMKYYFSVHAEITALIKASEAGKSIKGCTLYNNIAPCENCLKAMLAAGIARIVYRDHRPQSFYTARAKSLENIDTDKATIRLLASMPHVEAASLGGKRFIDEILADYPEGDESFDRLSKWVRGKK